MPEISASSESSLRSVIASVRSRRAIAAASRSLVIITLLLAACAYSPTDGKHNQEIGSVGDASLEGEVVTAVVERLESKAHEDFLEDGSVLASDVVALAIISPKPLSSLLLAHTHSHPRIAGRPMLLGDRVQFVLPHNWQKRDLSLNELERLAFAP